MSRILKSVIQDIINDNTESAQVSMHSYLVAKTQEVSGLTEGAEDKYDIDELYDLIDNLPRDQQDVFTHSGGVWLVPTKSKVYTSEDLAEMPKSKVDQLLKISTVISLYGNESKSLVTCKSAEIKDVLTSGIQQHLTSEYGSGSEREELADDCLTEIDSISEASKKKLKNFLVSHEFEYPATWYLLKVAEGMLLIGAQDD